MGTSSTAQYDARPGSGTLGDEAAVGVGDGGIEGLGDRVGEGVDVGGGAVGLAVAGATEIVGIGFEVADTGGGAQVSARDAQIARRSAPVTARRASCSPKREDPPFLAGLLVMHVARGQRFVVVSCSKRSLLVGRSSRVS